MKHDPCALSESGKALDEATKKALAHCSLPAPPCVPLLLCSQSGGIRYLNSAAVRLRGIKPHSPLLSLLPPEKQRLFARAGRGKSCFLPIPVSAPQKSEDALPTVDPMQFFLAVLSAYRNTVVLLGLPFFSSPMGIKRAFSEIKPPLPGKKVPLSLQAGPLAGAAATFIASRFLSKSEFRAPLSSCPWLDARLLALCFEKNLPQTVRSVGRTLHFIRQLFSFPEFFKCAAAPEIEATIEDPYAYLLKQSDAALIFLLTATKFAGDIMNLTDEIDSSVNPEKMKLFFYFQEKRLIIEFSVPCPMQKGARAPFGGAGKKAASAARALEDVYFPQGFQGFTLFTPNQKLLLASLQTVCRRFDWNFRGGIIGKGSEEKRVFLRLTLPVYPQKGAVLLSEADDAKSDFLQFLSFLCPKP